MAIIILPKQLNRVHAVNTANKMWSTPPTEDCQIDWQSVSWVEPFSLLYLATEISRFGQQRIPRACTFLNYRTDLPAHTYAAHMGFFEACGFSVGNKPGEADGSDTYLPITFLSIEELYKLAREEKVGIGQTIENHSRRLAKMLTRMETGELVETLTYSLQEIIRNVVEHSKSAFVGYCAQYWPQKQKVELAVLDSGIGVFKALSENPYLQIENDRHALHLALLPGMSGKAWKKSKKREDPEYDSFWDNSGFGLYVTSRLCADGGSFYISSGKSGMLFAESEKFDFDSTYQGTAIRMVLRTERREKTKQLLAKIVSEGSPIARQVAKGTLLSASVASQMLLEDFKKMSRL